MKSFLWFCYLSFNLVMLIFINQTESINKVNDGTNGKLLSPSDNKLQSLENENITKKDDRFTMTNFVMKVISNLLIIFVAIFLLIFFFAAVFIYFVMKCISKHPNEVTSVTGMIKNGKFFRTLQKIQINKIPINRTNDVSSVSESSGKPSITS